VEQQSTKVETMTDKTKAELIRENQLLKAENRKLKLQLSDKRGALSRIASAFRAFAKELAYGATASKSGHVA